MGMDNYNEEHDTITLTFEDGTEAECLVWGFVEVDGKSYHFISREKFSPRWCPGMCGWRKPPATVFR